MRIEGVRSRPLGGFTLGGIMRVTTLKDKYGNDYCAYNDKEFFIGEDNPDDAVLSFKKNKNGDIVISDKDKDFVVELTKSEAILLFNDLTKWVEGNA